MAKRKSLFDKECNKGSPVAWYLITSYLYYVHDVSIISDGTYDAMCKRLLDQFDTITHPHKHLLDKSALEAGSGFHLKAEDYPSMAVGSALRLAKQAGYG